MSNVLRVTALPLDVAFGDVESNLRAAEAALRDAAHMKPDIAVFPELMNTGFRNNVAEMHALAETDDGPTMTAMRRLAATHGCAIAGSLNAVADDDTCRNRGFFVQPDGTTQFYDKRHLFSLSKEAEIFARGRKPTLIVEFRGWKVALNVCYDLRFPAWMRNTGYAYDIMLLPANWSVARGYALEHLLIARAIENQASVVCCNLGGSDAFGSYEGCTYAFDQAGKPAFLPGTLTADFFLDKIQEARRYMPCDRDADRFEIQL